MAAFAVLILLLSAPNTPAKSMDIEVGFGGYVKTGEWFPVRVAPVEGAKSFDVIRVEKQRFSKEARPMALFLGRIEPDSSGYALCKIGESYPWGAAQELRCRITKADGSQVTEDIKPDVLNRDEQLILVVSKKPEEFEFLGTMSQAVVPVEPARFPSRWQEFTYATVVILDGSDADYSAVQKKALMNWLSAGGTVLITDRGMLTGPEKGTWGLFPEATCKTGGYFDVNVGALAPLLSVQTNGVVGLKGLAMDAGRVYSVLSSDGKPVILGKDVGRGRVVISGINWREMELKDKSTYESARGMFWIQLLQLRRVAREREREVSHMLAFPKEARAGYLAKPLGFFLIAYVIILGPVNWLVLRKLKRLEYSLFTLPSGALIFACLAFVIGVSLRSSEPVVHEAEVVTIEPSGPVVIDGVCGILSPDRSMYRVSIPNPAAMMEAEEKQDGGPGRQAVEPSQNELPIYWFDNGPGMANRRIRTWCMEFFATRSVEDREGDVVVDGKFEKDLLRGTVENKFPFVIRSACVIHRWRWMYLGDIKPGEKREFTLSLADKPDELSMVCPNCHRIHRTTMWFSEPFCKQHGIPPDLGEFIRNHGTEKASLLGIQEMESNSVQIDRSPAQSRRRRFYVCPVNIRTDDRNIVVPAGFAEELSDMRKYGSSFAIVQDISRLPYMLAIAQGGASEPEDPMSSRLSRMKRKKREEQGGENAVSYYMLPFTGGNVRTTALKIHWDGGEKLPDYKPISYDIAIYDWSAKKWDNLKRLSIGKTDISVDDPDRYVTLPYPVIGVKVTPVKHEAAEDEEQVYEGGYRLMEISYEGQRTNDNGTDDRR